GILVPISNAFGGCSPSVCPAAGCPQPPIPNWWGSWLTFILPYMEQDNLYKQVTLTTREYGYCAGPASPGATVVPTFICPSDYVPLTTIQYTTGGVTYYFGINSYFGNSGTYAWQISSASFNGVLFYNSSIRFADITDGTSSTFLAGERFSKDPI